ncbi:MAG TPA: hypothetical protein VHQ41_03810, partial [Patescibacteria group bacterium]|nr:hypothetical protein [Patescibacteria group bacterium]
LAAHGTATAAIAAKNLYSNPLASYFESQQDKIWTQRDKYNDSIKSAERHWEKHKDEFPELKNSKEYIQAAHEFYNKNPDGTLYRSLDKGREAYYNQKSNNLLILQSDGPATFMRPTSGIKYFNKLK